MRRQPFLFPFRHTETQGPSTGRRLPVQVGYFIHRRVDAAGVALIVPAAAAAALQFAVVVAVAAARVQEELVDAPVLDFLAVRNKIELFFSTGRLFFFFF